MRVHLSLLRSLLSVRSVQSNIVIRTTRYHHRISNARVYQYKRVVVDILRVTKRLLLARSRNARINCLLFANRIKQNKKKT